jgi:hypothetical protein
VFISYQYRAQRAQNQVRISVVQLLDVAGDVTKGVLYIKSFFELGLLAISATMLTVQATPTARTIPRPLTDYPGNIFVAGESVRLPAPLGDDQTWCVVDYEGRKSSLDVVVAMSSLTSPLTSF